MMMLNCGCIHTHVVGCFDLLSVLAKLTIIQQLPMKAFPVSSHTDDGIAGSRRNGSSGPQAIKNEISRILTHRQ
jgi:hypothetical protein